MGRLIRTVGHGTAPASDFIDLLAGAGVTAIADVRRFPGSRRHPHFGKDELERWLPASGIAYRWLDGLGGRRKVAPGSPNIGLRNAQFRAYADHMATSEFARSIRDLLELETSTRPAVMCSEAVWWRCHRRLLADHLVLVEGVEVEHLFHDGRVNEHAVTPGAQRFGTQLRYDPDASSTGFARSVPR